MIALMRFHVLFFAAVACGVAVDLLTKYAAFAWIAHGAAVQVIPGVLHFSPAANTGVAFSMLSGKTLLISSISLVAVGMLTWMYVKSWREGPPVLLLAIGMIFSGALGNLYDRVLLGYVRDFIDFVPQLPLIGHWAVFNVADICITVGVMLFLFWEFVLRPRAVAGAETKHA